MTPRSTKYFALKKSYGVIAQAMAIVSDAMTLAKLMRARRRQDERMAKALDKYEPGGPPSLAIHAVEGALEAQPHKGYRWLIGGQAIPAPKISNRNTQMPDAEQYTEQISRLLDNGRTYEGENGPIRRL